MDEHEAKRKLQDAIDHVESAWDDFGECAERIAKAGIDVLALGCSSVLEIKDTLICAMEAAECG